MQIAPEHLDAVVAHARRDAPNECCGLLELEAGRVVAVHAAENIAASPLRFEIGGRDLLRIAEIDDAGRDLAIYHSHTRSAAFPSQTDVNFARHWPGVQWLIVGLAGDAPEIRNFRIDGRAVTEVEVVVDGAG